jgi:hypothetical protein
MQSNKQIFPLYNISIDKQHSHVTFVERQEPDV